MYNHQTNVPPTLNKTNSRVLSIHSAALTSATRITDTGPVLSKETETDPETSNAPKAPSSDNTSLPECSITVCVRFRDLQPYDNFIYIDPKDPALIILKSNKRESNAFRFNHLFEPEVSQSEVYRRAAGPVVQAFLSGFNGAILAYGQSGTGKTFTMEGSLNDPNGRGIASRAVESIFSSIKSHSTSMRTFELRVSIFEIYCERIRDLLTPELPSASVLIRIREDRVGNLIVEGLQERPITSEATFLSFYREAVKRRATGCTNLNAHSSRSHLLVTLTLAQQDRVKGSQTISKLQLVDLAGSERTSKTKVEGVSLEEAKNINQSLAALGNVINALSSETTRSHVPYRDSKLTRVLQNSLGGNGITCLIICVSSQSQNESETLSTLRFGQRSQKVQNTLVKNEKWSLEALESKLALALKESEEIATYASSLELLIHNAGIRLPPDLCRNKSMISSLADAERNYPPDQKQVDRSVADDCGTACSVEAYHQHRRIAQQLSISRVGSTTPETCREVRGDSVYDGGSSIENSGSEAEEVSSTSSVVSESISDAATYEALSLLYIEIEDLAEQVAAFDARNKRLQSALVSKDDMISRLQQALKTAHVQYNLLFEQYERIFVAHHPGAGSLGSPESSCSVVPSQLQSHLTPPSPPPEVVVLKRK